MKWAIIKEYITFTDYNAITAEYEFLEYIEGTERQASAYCSRLERGDPLSKTPDMQKGEDGVWGQYPFTRVHYEFTDELEALFEEYKQMGYKIRNEGIMLTGIYTKEQLQGIIEGME